MISLYKQSIFRAFTGDQEILVGSMAVHTLSEVSFEDPLSEVIRHTKKLFLVCGTQLHTHTHTYVCMQTLHAHARTCTHICMHTACTGTHLNMTLCLGLLKSMTVLLILCGWCVHNKHHHLWVELCDQGKCPLKLLMTYLWSWGSSMLDTLSTGQDHWNLSLIHISEPTRRA